MNNKERIKDLKRSLSKLSKSIDELKTDGPFDVPFLEFKGPF